MKALAAVLAIAVLACAAMNVLLLQRMNQLEAKLSGPKTAPRAGPAEKVDDPAERVAARTDASPEAVPARTTVPFSGTAKSTEPAKGVVHPAELSPAMQAAMAAEVDRLVKEKYGDMPHMAFKQMEDPLSVMEKELVLTPNQKMEIGELWKKREDEMMKAMDGAKMGELPEKMKEIEGRYDAAIKQHLDLTQQAKYDGLKKDGKLMGGGVVFQVDMKVESPKDK
jgi:hypothetical protein